MKKNHLTSIQSTKAHEDTSITASEKYLNAPTNLATVEKFTYLRAIEQLYKSLNKIVKMRSFWLYRDVQEIYEANEALIDKALSIDSPTELWKCLKKKDSDQRIQERQQISFLVKLMIALDKIRKQLAAEGKVALFEKLKQAILLYETKMADYENILREKKYTDKMQKALKEKAVKEKQMREFEHSIHEKLSSDQKSQRHSFQEKSYLQTIHRQAEVQSNIENYIYKLKPSKLLSEAKNLSLRAKLAPYASEQKRGYDYRQLKSSLSKTLDLDMSRKLSVISNMKRVEQEKLNRSHRKRQSVLQDRLSLEKDMIQKELEQRNAELQNAEFIKRQKYHESNKKKQHQRVASLQKSLNTYNMRSDTSEIKKIIRNHNQNIQFSNQIEKVTNLSAYANGLTGGLSTARPRYGTITADLGLEDAEKNQAKRESQYQNKILRKFNTQKRVVIDKVDTDSEHQNDEDTSHNLVKRQKSLVALYDNDLKEI